MGFQNLRMMRRDGYTILLADLMPYSLFSYGIGFNCRAAMERQTPPRGIAFVFTCEKRADKAFRANSEDAMRHEMTHARRTSHPDMTELLAGWEVFHERNVDHDDDTAIKIKHPVPDGIDVHFRWSPKEQTYRLDAYTEKNGNLITRTVVLPSAPREMAEKIRQSYERFIRTSPAPRSRSMTWGVHVQRVIDRLEMTVTTDLSRWLDRVTDLPPHKRGEVADFVIPGEYVCPKMQFLRLRAVKGSGLIEGVFGYRKGHRLEHDRLVIKAAIPESMLSGMAGMSAEDVFEADELIGRRIIGHLTPAVCGNDDANVLQLEIETVPVHIPEGIMPDEEKARRIIAKNYAMMTVDEVLLGTMQSLSPSRILRIIRALKHEEEVDISHLEGSEVVRLRKNKDHISVKQPKVSTLGAALGMA